MSSFIEERLRNGVPVHFPPDLAKDPAPHPSLEFFLPETIYLRSESQCEHRRTSREYTILAALRILHFRYYRLEDAHIALCASSALSSLRVPLYVEPEMTLQQVVDVVKATITEREDASGSENCNGMLVEFVRDGDGRTQISE